MDKLKKFLFPALVILAGFAIGWGLNCKLSQSSLVKDDRVPMSCKIVLECLYYMQTGDKSGCFAHMGESCKYNTAYQFCSEKVQPNEDNRLYRADFELCLAKQGK